MIIDTDKLKKLIEANKLAGDVDISEKFERALQFVEGVAKQTGAEVLPVVITCSDIKPVISREEVGAAKKFSAL